LLSPPHLIHNNLSPPTIYGLPHETAPIGFEEVGVTLGIFDAGTWSVGIFFAPEGGRIKEVAILGDEDIQVIAPLDDLTPMLPEILGIIGIHISCPEEQMATAKCIADCWVADSMQLVDAVSYLTIFPFHTNSTPRKASSITTKQPNLA
jgi:hypothetical protein